MSLVKDRRLRRAPDRNGVLMYRLGLSRKRIAELLCVHPAVVGYNLTARRQDPGLEAAHQAAAGAKTCLSPTSLARMEAVIACVSAEGRLPRDRSENKAERSTAPVALRPSARSSRRHPRPGLP